MAYSKRIPPIKLILSIKEYNNLIGILTNNIDSEENESIIELAKITKEKLLKHSVPKQYDDKTEIELRLYINEASDIISQLLLYLKDRMKEIDYYQVLLKVRENIEKSND